MRLSWDLDHQDLSWDLDHQDLSWDLDLFCLGVYHRAYHLSSSVQETWRVRPSSMIFMFKSSPVYSGATAISAAVPHVSTSVPCQHFQQLCPVSERSKAVSRVIAVSRISTLYSCVPCQPFSAVLCGLSSTAVWRK